MQLQCIYLDIMTRKKANAYCARIVKPVHYSLCLTILYTTDSMWREVNFKQNIVGLYSNASLSLTDFDSKVKKPSLPCYLSISGWRTIIFKLFPRLLAPCEMQVDSTKIWTRITGSILNYDNLLNFERLQLGDSTLGLDYQLVTVTNRQG